MKQAIFLTAGAALLALTACGQSGTAESDGATNDTAMMNDPAMMNDGGMNDVAANSGDPAAASTTAAGFVPAVAASDMFEIETGQLASQKATDPGIKSFGQMLVTDHRKSSTELKAAAAKASPAVTPPTTLPADKRAKVDALKAASGAEFDRLFVEQQIEAHTMASNILGGYASGGESEPLKAFAAKTRPVVQAHLEKLNGMKK
jgi:putative membrane protein